MADLKISVIVPTLNRPNDLRRCLMALKAQKRLPDEIIVVVGPGDKVAGGILKEISVSGLNCRCLSETHPSLIRSLNLGIQAAQGDIIALTDDDAAASPDWLRVIEAHYLRDCKVGAVGGRDRLMYVDQPQLSDPPPARLVGTFNWYGRLAGNHHCGAVHSPVDVDVLKGVNLTFRRSAFMRGQIDSYLTGYGAEVGSEVDICLSIRGAGFRIVYDNVAFVEHYPGPRISGDDRLEMDNVHALRRTQNIAYLNGKFHSLIPALILLLRATLFGSRHQPGCIRGLVGVLMGRRKHLNLAGKVIRYCIRGAIDGRKSRRGKGASHAL